MLEIRQIRQYFPPSKFCAVRYIHKLTTVWIFQKGEQLSSDWLIRVWETQPSSTSKTATSSTTTTPEKNDIISVGDICVFMNRESSDCDWKFGKILQFGYYLEKTKKARQYTECFVKCNKNNMNKFGIVCS